MFKSCCMHLYARESKKTSIALNRCLHHFWHMNDREYLPLAPYLARPGGGPGGRPRAAGRPPRRGRAPSLATRAWFLVTRRRTRYRTPRAFSGRWGRVRPANSGCNFLASTQARMLARQLIELNDGPLLMDHHAMQMLVRSYACVAFGLRSWHGHLRNANGPLGTV
jgi:hypothetical protein